MTELNFPTGYDLLSRRIEDFGAFRKRWAWFDALAWFVVLGPGSMLLLALLDWLVPMPWYVLLLLCAVSAQLMLHAAIFPIMRPAGLRVASCIIYAPGVLFGLIVLRALGRRLAPGSLLALDLSLTVCFAGWLLAAERRDHPRFACCRRNIEREALILESLHGGLDNQIIGSLQLSREVAEAQSSGKSVGYSISIVSALVTRTADNIGKLNVWGLLDRSKAFRNLGIASGIMVGFIVLAVTAPRVLADRASRIRDAYATLMDLLFPVNMVVTPGDVAVVRGTPVLLGVDIAEARRHNVQLVLTDLKTKKVVTGDYALDADHRFALDVKAAGIVHLSVRIRRPEQSAPQDPRRRSAADQRDEYGVDLPHLHRHADPNAGRPASQDPGIAGNRGAGEHRVNR